MRQEQGVLRGLPWAPLFAPAAKSRKTSNHSKKTKQKLRSFEHFFKSRKCVCASRLQQDQTSSPNLRNSVWGCVNKVCHKQCRLSRPPKSWNILRTYTVSEPHANYCFLSLCYREMGAIESVLHGLMHSGFAYALGCTYKWIWLVTKFVTTAWRSKSWPPKKELCMQHFVYKLRLGES